MEGPLAPIQVSQKETGRVRVPQPGTEAPENLGLVSVCFWLLQVLFSFIHLLWVRLLPLALQILLLQLLLQSLLQAQLFLRQQVQVKIFLIFSLSFSNTISSQATGKG